jgi:hypothetical protein
LKGAEGSQAAKHWKDGGATQPGQHWKDAEGAQPGKHWKDAAGPGKRREASDTTGLRAGRPIVDDRKALDNAALEDDDGIGLGEELLERMDAVGERTRTIRDYLDPLLSAKSIAAGSRLPDIPASPPRQSAVTSAAILRIEPQTNPSDNEGENSQPMLLASDEGGPIMTQSLPAASKEESRLNRQLRYWSLVLLPALFLTYGATMVGETTSGHSFITSENLATDARTVHQMATVQQTVYRIAPDGFVELAGRFEKETVYALAASVTFLLLKERAVPQTRAASVGIRESLARLASEAGKDCRAILAGMP